MRNYYTRACNFYYGSQAQNLIKKKLALPLSGNKNLAFNHIEILSRDKKIKLIHIKKINTLEKKLKQIERNSTTHAHPRMDFSAGREFRIQFKNSNYFTLLLPNFYIIPPTKS